MTSEKSYSVLNELMNIEFKAHYYYMQAASWAAFKNLEGCHNFLLGHAKEEYSHVMKIFTYLMDLGGEANFSGLSQPDIDANDIEGLFSLIYKHECDVTKAYDEAVAVALEEKDNQLLFFLQWFVSEQDEEMILCRKILDKIKLIGSGPHSLYLFDQEMATLANKS
ncbi:ferritin [Candidatus Liberibacter africanus]|uniref:Ferritin n=1 Tax=Candidatus Liberibacter africanus PTSAPSY TaxID=1277257 RepID=A0A0G3I6C7_LIBAF|nr:ferritin [Candidatus Liberibacter africanus]AKK20018.1 ferroxidase [Candidatus Liberibacter africanus PTSAPSY]QTP63846.1 ferritin [Candidatus Liberibacter africanus]